MQKDLIFYLKRITGIILLLALSAVFLFSAFTKLLVIEPFEWTFIDLFSAGFTTAGVMARLFIALELGIAFLLLAHLYLRSFTYKAAFALLLLLTGYLVILYLRQGNTGNCGCFGDTYQMTPLAAIGKNGVMMLALGVLYLIYPVSLVKGRTAKKVVAGICVAGALALPFVLSPMYHLGGGEVTHQPINLQPVYDQGEPKPAIDLKRGRHVVAFMSLTCPHCRKTAYLIHILHHQYPDISFYMVLNGRRKWDRDFFRETKAEKVPYSILRDIPAFSSMAGDYVPAIYWINNSIIERKTYYNELDPNRIEAWMLGR